LKFVRRAGPAAPGRARVPADGAWSALDAVGVDKVYGGTVALDGVDFQVRQGEIHGLLGENGAGKSTLVRIMAGIEPADRGSVSLFGTVLPPEGDPAAVRALGCAFIHQNRALVDDLTVTENVAAVVGYATRAGVIDWTACRAAARRALEMMGVAIDVESRVADLPVASQAIVAVARALAQQARLLFLDEPTASLQQAEVRILFNALDRLRQQGVASVLISHRIDEVLDVCDRVTVLRDGRVTGVREVEGLGKRELMRLIVGRDIEPHEGHAMAGRADDVLAVDGLAAPGVGPVSLTVRGGEIVAVTGLADGGHIELGETLFGLRPIVAGRVRIPGCEHVPRSIRDAMAARIAYVPSDRAAAGAPTLTLRENLFMSPPGVVRPVIRAGRERAVAGEILRRFDVRPPEPDRELGTLSGGNQQKVVLAKWISRSPQLLILNEPTAAVDVGAKADIYRQLRQACNETGLAVLLVSSDLEEVEIVADRAYVLVKGRVAAVLEGDAITQARLASAAYGMSEVAGRG
jgi:ribose transport system ATP-binding protein